MKSDSSSHVKLWSSRCVSSVNSSRCFLSNKHRLTFKPAALLETVRAANHLLTRGSTSLHVLCAVLRRRIKNLSSGCSRGRERTGPGRAEPGLRGAAAAAAAAAARSGATQRWRQRDRTDLFKGLDVELITDVYSWIHPTGGLSRYCGEWSQMTGLVFLPQALRRVGPTEVLLRPQCCCLLS